MTDYWAPFDGSGGAHLSRYANGEWTVLRADATYPMAVRAAAAGRVCTLDYDPAFEELRAGRAIVCHDGEGEIARFDLMGMEVWDFSVAPDGTVWVSGSQLGRLVEHLPTR